jgi:hypothetical protein
MGIRATPDAPIGASGMTGTNCRSKRRELVLEGLQKFLIRRRPARR